MRFSANTLKTSGGERAKYMSFRKRPGMISLDAGIPVFDTPAHIREAAKEFLDRGYTRNSVGPGEPEFLDAVREKVAREAGADYAPHEVIATSGSTSGITAVLSAFLEPGDEVLLFDPTFSLYAFTAEQLGAVPVWVPHDEALQLDVGAARAAVTPRTKLVVLNNPNNPTGIVYRREGLEALLGLCAEKNLLLLADEAYEKILQPGYEHVPILSFQDHRERIILANTFSKTYAMTGWRLGYLVAPEAFATTLVGLHRGLTGPVCSFIQMAGAAALRGPHDFLEEFTAAYHRRGALMYELAGAIPGLLPNTPQGGFYVFCRYEFPLPSAEVRARLFEAGLACRSGLEYGPRGEGHLRFSYPGPEENIRKGMEIVREVFAQLG